MNEQRSAHWSLKKNLILQDWDLEENDRIFGRLDINKDSKVQK
jgi:hypothetical protein